MATVRSGDSDGLVPLYDFMLAFLDDGVQKGTIGDFIRDNNINSWSEVGDYSSEAVQGMMGFFVCVATGLVFILVFSVVGCVYGCCRGCCGKCQPQKDNNRLIEESQLNKKPYKKYGCASVLGVMAAVMFSMVICNFVAAGKVKDELGGKTTGDITQSLGYIGQFLDQTTEDVYQGVFPPLEETTNNVLKALYDLPVQAEAELARQTGIDPALYILVNYTQNLPQLLTNLESIDSLTAELEVYAVALSSDLEGVRSAVSSILDDCGAPCVGAVTDNLDDLRTGTNYTEIQPMADYATAVEVAIANGIVEETAALLESYEDISETIANTTNKEVGEIEREIAELNTELLGYFHDLYNFTQDANQQFAELTDRIEDDIQPTIDEYSSYALAPFFTLTSVCLIITLLILAALPVGLFLGAQGAGHGSRMLMASVVLTFSFGWLFMLFTTAFFVAGGIGETMVCRHLRTFDDSAQEMARLTRSDIDLEYNLTLKELIDNCKADQTLYTALKVAENKLNVSELLSIEGSAVEDALREIASTKIDLPDVTIMTPEISIAVLALANLTGDIPYDSVYAATSQPVTVYDLGTYANDLEAAADQVAPGMTRDTMEAQVVVLRGLEAGIVADMETDRAALNAATTSAEVVTSTDLVAVITNLTVAQEVINDESETIVSGAINDTCLSVYRDMDTFSDGLVSSIENDIGNCAPVYDASNLMVQSACAYMLHPLNVMWFTYGWFIAFAAIALWLSTALIGMFRVDVALSKIAPSPMDTSMPYVGYMTTKDGLESKEKNEALNSYTSLALVVKSDDFQDEEKAGLGSTVSIPRAKTPTPGVSLYPDIEDPAEIADASTQEPVPDYNEENSML